MNFVSKPRSFLSKTRNFVSETRNFVALSQRSGATIWSVFKGRILISYFQNPDFLIKASWFHVEKCWFYNVITGRPPGEPPDRSRVSMGRIPQKPRPADGRKRRVSTPGNMYTWQKPQFAPDFGSNLCIHIGRSRYGPTAPDGSVNSNTRFHLISPDFDLIAPDSTWFWPDFTRFHQIPPDFDLISPDFDLISPDFTWFWPDSTWFHLILTWFWPDFNLNLWVMLGSYVLD